LLSCLAPLVYLLTMTFKSVDFEHT